MVKMIDWKHASTEIRRESVFENTRDIPEFKLKKYIVSFNLRLRSVEHHLTQKWPFDVEMCYAIINLKVEACIGSKYGCGTFNQLISTRLIYWICSNLFFVKYCQNLSIPNFQRYQIKNNSGIKPECGQFLIRIFQFLESYRLNIFKYD